jgi:hypothetical protein
MVIGVPVFGGMAEWFKAAVLKTVERKFRGFESYSLRHIANGFFTLYNRMVMHQNNVR